MKSINQVTTQPNQNGMELWSCGVVSVCDLDRESCDAEVAGWLSSQLLQHIDGAEGVFMGGDCYHLKGRGGVKQVTEDLGELLQSGKYPYMIRSDPKAYYAHIRHHKLVGLLKENVGCREVCPVVTELCLRMTVRGGIYSACKQGIPLGCAASLALAAIYLSPLDNAIKQIPGVKYLRYMDDWVILCPSRWKMHRVVKLMQQTLHTLGQYTHPDKTFFGKTSKGFDFLGVESPASSTPPPTTADLSFLSPSTVSVQRLSEKLQQHLSSCAWLYEQGRLKNLDTMKRYLKHWLSWAKGIRSATMNSLEAIATTLQNIGTETNCRMIETFTQWIAHSVNTQTIQLHYETNKETSCTMGSRSIRNTRQPRFSPGCRS